MAESEDNPSSDKNEDEMVGYRQQPGKLPFSKPGSGGKNRFSQPTDAAMIPESQGGKKSQPWGSHRHDKLVSGQIIGKPTALVDSRWKVTGQAHYGDDVRLAGELIGRIIRSPHHYARVLSIDCSKALELPGVVAIATGADAANKFGVLPVTKDEHAMAVEKVRHAGDLVACVAAEDEATAREAERLIEVEYEILDSIHDMRHGLDDSENPIHDRGKYHIGEANVQKRVFQEVGDIDGMASSAVASHKQNWVFAGVNHAATEPHAVVAHWDPSGRLTLYTPQQVTHLSLIHISAPTRPY